MECCLSCITILEGIIPKESSDGSSKVVVLLYEFSIVLCEP